ncbi:S1 family peptidase [Pararhizobium qamdonense]|uniref:S1 family peptidase n=1 Tax=Pararhizobium qamdonense TaxID=3031126 RepID=UPI0023E1819F|nr:serine protease [Pararhizobium qamdonense]
MAKSSWRKKFKKNRAEKPPIILPPLLGTDEPDKYLVFDNDGGRPDLKECVVPIFYVSKAEPREWRFVGTAFFIAQNLVATARHVVEDIFVDNHQAHDPYIFQRSGESEFRARPLISICRSASADIAIAQLSPIAGHKHKVLPLRETEPSIGEITFTYAFPNSAVVRRDDGQFDIVMNPAFYRGTVVEIFPEGRDSVMLPWPCSRVNFFMHPGSSGGPVFDEEGRVFGVNCMSGEPERNVAYVTAIKTLINTALNEVIFEGEFHRELPFERLLEAGVIQLF